MSFLNRAAPKQPASALARRVSMTADYALVEWLELAVMGMGRAVSDYRRNGEGPALDEIERGAEAVLAVTGELRRRHLHLMNPA